MEGLVKVTFDLPSKDGRVASESLSAEAVGGNSYRLRNVPVYVYGYSERDIVRAEPNESRLKVRGIVERGGHSTYRAFLAEQTTEEQFNKDWVPLGELGCSYERATQRLIAVDVPPLGRSKGASSRRTKNELLQQAEGHMSGAANGEILKEQSRVAIRLGIVEG